ncbi:unnamed protein product [Blepharisma stoltei]|uniref:Uncharacterized protein n=1 Tax=Blepharisma stoltei TaxID=1481888 RepID=A0AAU9K4D9_9CILI|nr:unnamed protein product [Blepharisma stoltei]
MENKRIGDIDRLLQKLKEENNQYRNSKKLQEEIEENKENPDYRQDEEEEEDYLPSRYKREPSYHSESEEEEGEEQDEDQEENSGREDIREAESEDEELSEEEEEDTREKIRKRLEEIRKKKNQLGPPVRVEKAQEAPQRPHTAKPQIYRPQSAKFPKTPSFFATPITTKKKKSDPVALFNQRQREWKSNAFLRSNTLNTREGRKLNLNPPQKDFEVVKASHDYRKNNYVAPHEKRRDDIRNITKMKMLSAHEC